MGNSGRELDPVKEKVLKNVIETGVGILHNQDPKKYKELVADTDFTPDATLWIGAMQTIFNAL